MDAEGKRLQVYNDTGGVPTIGVGHKLLKEELDTKVIKVGDREFNYSNGLTCEEVYDILHQDLIRFEQNLNEKVKVPLTQNQFDALVIFSFNIGVHQFNLSTLLRLLNQGQYGEIPNQLRRWIHDNGKVEKGLVNRREKEVKLWNS